MGLVYQAFPVSVYFAFHSYIAFLLILNLFDAFVTKCFIEERYHEEYLDVGTICDGEYLIEDDDLWERLIKEKNKEGIFEFLKIRGTVEKIDER